MLRRGFIARVAIAIVLAAAAPGSALAAVDAFLSIDGVRGDSRAPGHTGHIEIYSWSLGSTNSTVVSHGTGGGAGKVSQHEFTITKSTDSASPVLMRASTVSQHYPKAVLYVRKAGGEQATFLVYTFTDVTVVSVRMAGGGDRPMESITFAYQGMSVSSAPANDPSARPTPIMPKMNVPPKTTAAPKPH